MHRLPTAHMNCNMDQWTLMALMRGLHRVTVRCATRMATAANGIRLPKILATPLLAQLACQAASAICFAVISVTRPPPSSARTLTFTVVRAEWKLRRKVYAFVHICFTSTRSHAHLMHVWRCPPGLYHKRTPCNGVKAAHSGGIVMETL